MNWLEKKSTATEDSSENNEATENKVNEIEKMKKENLQYHHTRTQNQNIGSNLMYPYEAEVHLALLISSRH